MASTIVGQEVFPSAKALRERCRALLHSCTPEEPISAEGHAFLLALLSRHREAGAKVGCGVRDFFVRIHVAYRNRGFYLRRIDGTVTDFSFEACIKTPTRRAEAMKGFRSAVADQTGSFKQRRFASGSCSCALTGESLAFEDAHVDHESPLFVDLVQGFLAARGLSIESVSVNPTEDLDTQTRLLDRDLEAAFAAYHQSNARLRILSKTANLSRTKAGE